MSDAWWAWLPAAIALAAWVGWRRGMRVPISGTAAAWLRRQYEDWHQVHVPARCRPDGCSCPCGACRHGGRCDA